MDWISDFTIKFSHYPELQDLKEKQFYGSLELNFCNGVVQSFNYKKHGRAVKDIEYTDVRQGPTRAYKH